MENRGQVNRYSPYKWDGPSFYTINLSAGTTPMFLIEGGREYASAWYTLAVDPGVCRIHINVRHAWYRPGITEYKAADADTQDHVLNGGLLHRPLVEALGHLIVEDPVETTWAYEQFQAWALKTYGRRLPPLKQ